MPKVSVNIPCFNSAGFIKETLESVLSQTYGDYEIVVTDDGSVDDTGTIVKSFSDPRIKYFYKENEGLVRTRNKAVSLSRGEYIAFLDHDDLWMPEKLKKQLGILERDKNIGLVFSNSYVLKNGKKDKMTYFDIFAPKKGFIFDDLLFESSNFIPMPTVVMRRDIFDDVGFFNAGFTIAEELEFFIRMAEKYRFDYVDEPLAAYRMHDTNASHNKEAFARELFAILDYWQNKKPDLFKKNKNRLLKKQADILAELANFYALSSNRNKSLHNFNLSLKHCKNRNQIVRKYVLLILGCSMYKMFEKSIGFYKKWRIGRKKENIDEIRKTYQIGGYAI